MEVAYQPAHKYTVPKFLVDFLIHLLTIAWSCPLLKQSSSIFISFTKMAGIILQIVCL